MKRKVLLLGGSGLIAPNLMAGLDPYYDVTLADVKPHPDGREILTVDISDYEQVCEAATGMDALMNWTVVRDDPDLSFHVNTRGALNVRPLAVVRRQPACAPGWPGARVRLMATSSTSCTPCARQRCRTART